MAKVITIKDEAYEKLLKIKKLMRGSFSDAILYLYRVYEKVSGKQEFIEMAGSLRISGVDRRKLRKVLKYE